MVWHLPGLTISSSKLNSHKLSYRRSFLLSVLSNIAEKNNIWANMWMIHTKKEMFFISVPLKEKQVRVPSLNLSYISLQTGVISLWNFANYLSKIEKIYSLLLLSWNTLVFGQQVIRVVQVDLQSAHCCIANNYQPCVKNTEYPFKSLLGKCPVMSCKVKAETEACGTVWLQRRWVQVKDSNTTGIQADLRRITAADVSYAWSCSYSTLNTTPLIQIALQLKKRAANF